MDSQYVLKYLKDKNTIATEACTSMKMVIDYNITPKEYLTYIIHSGFISGYQNRYGDNLKPPTNVYHRMTA